MNTIEQTNIEWFEEELDQYSKLPLDQLKKLNLSNELLEEVLNRKKLFAEKFDKLCGLTEEK